jgi:phage tail sheath gpL-like
MLPSPSGTVAVLILGGASNVTIYRPAGVSARLRVEGGATNLTFDGRHTGAAGGELDLRTSNHDGATDRYEFAITGGANNVSIEGDERSEP